MRDHSIDRRYRSIPEERRHDSREWKRGWGNHKEDAPARRQWKSHCDSRDIKTKDHDGWGEVTNEEVAPADIKTKDHDGWGEGTTGEVALADGASGWENVPIGDRSNWNKPPDIESVNYWDDSAVRETWELLQRRQTPKPDWDLYIERHINWNSRIPRELLESVDAKRRPRTVCVSQSRSPVILGLETLVDAQVLDTGSKKLSVSNHQHGKGGSSGWGDPSQKTLAVGQGTQPQIVSGAKRKAWDSLKEKNLRNRSGTNLQRHGEKIAISTSETHTFLLQHFFMIFSLWSIMASSQGIQHVEFRNRRAFSFWVIGDWTLVSAMATLQRRGVCIVCCSLWIGNILQGSPLKVEKVSRQPLHKFGAISVEARDNGALI